MKLEACPFCGHKTAPILVINLDDFLVDVRCNYISGGCGAQTARYHSELEAIEAWNRRAK